MTVPTPSTTLAVDTSVFPEEKAAARLARLASLMDDRYRIPGTGIRYGWDGILSLVPVAGDTAGAVVSAYLILECWRMGVKKRTLSRMLGNLGLDFALGSVPVIGTVFDVGFKANRRNMRLAQEALKRVAEERRAGAA
ncbi:MAG: DUF4112 domain-containing protein [Geminicoccaceae bacterium]|nr:DUF4112 domain-containing protein [Geminicoccaceae bacterium]